MARRLRIEFPGAVNHIMSRGKRIGVKPLNFIWGNRFQAPQAHQLFLDVGSFRRFENVMKEKRCKTSR